MIPSDENNASGRPELDKDHPHVVSEGTPVVVGHTNTQGGGGLLASLVDQGGGDDVLDPGPGIAPGDPHQELQAVGGQGDRCGREEGEEGEESLPGPV